MEFQKEIPCPTLIPSKSSCGVAEVKQNVLRAAQARAAQPHAAQSLSVKKPDILIYESARSTTDFAIAVQRKAIEQTTCQGVECKTSL